MNDLLARLLVLFTAKMITEEDYLASIHIYDNFSMEMELKTHHLPTLIITPVGDRHEQGAFANTAREIYNINLRIVARSVESYAYQVEPISGTTTNLNVHQLTGVVRGILYENKKLTDEVFEMRPMFSVKDMFVLWNRESGRFSAREISLEYTKLELYTGMQNEQSSLDPAYQF